MLKNLKIISGGQTGADLAGLWAAKLFGVETGGLAPAGFKTLIGPQPGLKTLFNLEESASPNYRIRTIENVKASDLTILCCSSFLSPGSKLTIGACLDNKVPFVTVPFVRDASCDDETSKLTSTMAVEEACRIIKGLNLLKEDIVINIAGNSTKTSKNTFEHTFIFMCNLLETLGYVKPPMTYAKLVLIKDFYMDVEI